MSSLQDLPVPPPASPAVLRSRLPAEWSLARKLLGASLGRLSLPYRLNFIVTKECHSRCVNCRIWEQKPQDELNLDEIEKLARNSGFLSWINFSGGEPTDRPDFDRIVQAFLRHCPELVLVHFPTNSLRPDRVLATTERIVANSRARQSLKVTVSLDGPPQEHDRLRGTPGNFERAIETYRGLLRLPGVDPYIGMTLFATNHKRITETLEELRARISGFELSRFHVNLAHRSDHYYGNSRISRTVTPEMIESLSNYQALRRAEWRKLSWRARLRAFPVDWIENRFHELAKSYLKTGKTPLPCAALLSSCFLDERGTLFPCSVWSEPIGSIREHGHDLKPLLTGGRAQELRARLVAGRCAHCWTPCEAYQSIAASSPFRSPAASSETKGHP
jgi:MoaA/NifB/PqqE/SkfB family radical SAM enzyme